MGCKQNKITQAELAKIAGTTPKSLRDWRDNEGLDLSNISDVKRRAKSKMSKCGPPRRTSYLTRAEERQAWSKNDYNKELRAYPDWSILWEREQNNRKQCFTQHWQHREILALYKRENKAFADWGCLWREHKKNKAKREKYHAMTPEQKVANGLKANAYRKAAFAKDPHRRLAHNRRRQEKIKESPPARVQQSLRARLRKFTIGKTSHSISQLIGCTQSEFVSHIEAQFQRGMSWDNYGAGWHLDHIIPCASFNHSDPKQVETCWHWTNLQPLWASENCSKQDKITTPQMNLKLDK